MYVFGAYSRLVLDIRKIHTSHLHFWILGLRSVVCGFYLRWMMDGDWDCMELG